MLALDACENGSLSSASLNAESALANLGRYQGSDLIYIIGAQSRLFDRSVSSLIRSASMNEAERASTRCMQIALRGVRDDSLASRARAIPDHIECVKKVCPRMR